MSNGDNAPNAQNAPSPSHADLPENQNTETGGQNKPLENSGNSSSHFPFWKGNGRIFKSKDLLGEDRYPKRKVELNLPDRNASGEVASMGELVTSFAANAMVKDFGSSIDEKFTRFSSSEAFRNLTQEQQDELADFFIDILGSAPHKVIFGKESLLFLLAQTSCEGVRFYYCKGPSGDPSLVLVGVNNLEEDLGTEGSIIIEDFPYTPDPDDEPAGAPLPNAPDATTERQTLKAADRQRSAIVEVGGTDNPKQRVVTQLDLILSTENPGYAPALRNFILNRITP